MTFDLFVRRSQRGFLRNSVRGLADSDLESALGGGPEKVRKGNTWRISRPDTGEPWFVAFVKGGEIVLSTSYSNHRYLANFADMFDAGLIVADRVGGQLFDEVRSTRIFKGGDLDRLLDLSGDYVRLQADTFHANRVRLQGEFAGLEWPLDEVDVVSQYCVFRVVTATPPPPIAECLSRLQWPYSALSDDTASLDADQMASLALGLVVRREDQSLQVWPTYASASFERCATRCRDVAVGLARQLDGSVEFNREPLTGAFADEVNARLAGYGTDLYEWIRDRSRTGSA